MRRARADAAHAAAAGPAGGHRPAARGPARGRAPRVALLIVVAARGEDGSVGRGVTQAPTSTGSRRSPPCTRPRSSPSRLRAHRRALPGQRVRAGRVPRRPEGPRAAWEVGGLTCPACGGPLHRGGRSPRRTRRALRERGEWASAAGRARDRRLARDPRPPPCSSASTAGGSPCCARSWRRARRCSTSARAGGGSWPGLPGPGTRRAASSRRGAAWRRRARGRGARRSASVERRRQCSAPRDAGAARRGPVAAAGRRCLRRARARAPRRAPGAARCDARGLDPLRAHHVLARAQPVRAMAVGGLAVRRRPRPGSSTRSSATPRCAAATR